MFIFKIAIFVVITVITFITLIKNVNRWGISFRQYMLSQSNKVFRSGVGWEKPWTVFLSKAMVVFFGLMFIVLAYVIIFSL